MNKRGKDVKDSRDQSRRAHCIKTEKIKKPKVLRLKREDLHILRCTGFCFMKKNLALKHRDKFYMCSVVSDSL